MLVSPCEAAGWGWEAGRQAGIAGVGRALARLGTNRPWQANKVAGSLGSGLALSAAQAGR